MPKVKGFPVYSETAPQEPNNDVVPLLMNAYGHQRQRQRAAQQPTPEPRKPSPNFTRLPGASSGR